MHNIASCGETAFATPRRFGASDFAQAAIAGLAQAQKTVPARFLYDRRGSELFEAITALPEYYPTPAEIEILSRRSGEIARLTSGRVVVEFGSGSSVKTPLLLNEVDAAAYVPIDISEGFLRDSAARIRRGYPGLAVLPVAGDFTQAISLPPEIRGRPALGFFPGSTIGNFTPAAAARLLSGFAATLGADAYLAIGIDLRKDAQRIEAAYDDRAGVTAAFNLNLLDRVNRELDGDIPRQAFLHRAIWNEALSRIEMHLAATQNVAFTVAGKHFRMAVGETIHTENSYKYCIREARLLAGIAGWEPVSVWTDEKDLFSLHLWRVARPVLQP